MIITKNLLIFGAILLFVGICLPFFLIASKGLGQSSTMGAKRKREALSLKENIFYFIWTLIILFIVLPLILSTLYHLIQHVFWGGMPFNEFTNSLSAYSYQPVIDFYKQTFSQINALMTQQPPEPK